MIASSDTLFNVSHPTLDVAYVPQFFTNVSHMFGDNQTVINQANILCGDVSTNRECYFDYAVTASAALAAEGKTFLAEAKEVITSISKYCRG